MQLATNRTPQPSHLVELTLQAMKVARAAAASAAQGIATGNVSILRTIRDREKELDTIDRDVDELVTTTITHVDDAEARDLLACMKFVISLERAGDLLLNFANRAEAAGTRIDSTDIHDLTTMATRLEVMLTDIEFAYCERSLDRAVAVLRADAELDRLRNLIVMRHLEPGDSSPRQESFHVVFMAQELERVGDHVKNMAEEVCHLVSGQTVRHVLRDYDRPVKQMFLHRLTIKP